MHTFNTAWQKLFGDKSAADVLEAAESTNTSPHDYATGEVRRLLKEDPYHGFDERHAALFGDIVDTLERASRGENVGSFLPTLPARSAEPMQDEGEPVSDPYPPVDSSPQLGAEDTGEFAADGTETDEP